MEGNETQKTDDPGVLLTFRQTTKHGTTEADNQQETMCVSETGKGSRRVATAGHRGESHTVHFEASPVLLSMQTEHVHCPPAAFGGGLTPAAAQLKP